jgi:hypothetical protein
MAGRCAKSSRVSRNCPTAGVEINELAQQTLAVQLRPGGDPLAQVGLLGCNLTWVRRA